MLCRCDDCKFAEWKRTASGRLHPDKSGRCGAVIPKLLPKAFYWFGGGPCIGGGHISRCDPAAECAYWEKSEAQK